MVEVQRMLILRGTFIHFESSDFIEARRARSLSPQRSKTDGIFSNELQYVNSLRSKCDVMWSRTSCLNNVPVHTESSKVTEENLSIAMGATGKVGRLNKDAFGSASTTASGLTTASTAITNSQFVFDDFDSGSDICDADYVDQVAFEDASPPSLEDEPFVCVGSRGHPELCMNPCSYFAARGHCASGKSCNFCHMDHNKRPVHFDKRKREMLRGMTYEECIELVEPILNEKAASMKFNAEAALLMDLLCGRARSAARKDQKSTRKKTALTKTMSSMTFMSLTTFLIGRSDAPASVRGNAVHEAISKLRLAVPF